MNNSPKSRFFLSLKWIIPPVLVGLAFLFFSNSEKEAEQQNGLASDPIVFDLQPRSVTFLWHTRTERIGKVQLRGENSTKTKADQSRTNMHKVRINDLEPGTTYQYLIEDRFSGSITTPEEFPPQTFAVFGHPGGTQGPYEFPYRTVAGCLSENAVDFALCTGDICYNTTIESFKKFFLRPFRTILKSRPIYLAPGNHEAGFPTGYGLDYSVFRSFFPYDFPDAELPYHKFVRGNIEFYAISYTAIDREKFRRQMSWLENALAQSQSEFRIVFFGGAQKTIAGYDEERLFQVMQAGDVDIAFGGDGSGSFHEIRNDVPYYFAGTNGPNPHDFFVVTADAYALRIRQYDASMTALKHSATYYSRRTKPIAYDLLPTLSRSPGTKATAGTSELEIASGEYDGIRLTIENPLNKKTGCWLLWAPKDMSRRGGNAYFREPWLELPATKTSTHMLALPRLNPRTGEPYTLKSIQVRLIDKKINQDFNLIPQIKELSLFKDPLKK